MKRLFILLSISGLLLVHSCTTTGIFSRKSPHEQYADKLKQAGLHQSKLGSTWLQQAEEALQSSLAVNIPYRENGYFAADVPRSAGLRFRPRQGQRIFIEVSVKPQGSLLFIELWRSTKNTNKPEFVAAADSSLSIIYEVDDNNELILRLQPELLATVSYSLSVLAEPSLGFPVPGNDGKKVGSFWGDQRGGGARKHEGIDIFGKSRSPLIAAEDGLITRTGENGLGGKVIWLRPKGKNYSLYYAHLDEHLVSGMQQVKKGDTIGLMGNTGNARTTPTHLHFGIYASGGAVDPLPFVQQVSKETDPIKGALLNAVIRTSGKASLQNSPDKKSVQIMPVNTGTFLQVTAATGSFYKVTTADGIAGFVSLAQVNELDKPLQTVTLSNKAGLFAQADSSTAVIKELPSATPVKIFARTGLYAYVQAGNTNGWMLGSHLDK